MTPDRTHPLHIVSRDGFAAWLARQLAVVARWL